MTDPARAQLKQFADALETYTQWCGGVHDDLCPEDDTCDCSVKWVNDGVNGLVHYLREAVSRLREPEAPAVWQPMETAPKDGTEVLLRVKSRAGERGKMLVGHYMPGGHCIEDHPPIDDGWYFWNGCMFDRASEPTHWMPLPPAESPVSAREPEAPVFESKADGGICYCRRNPCICLRHDAECETELTSHGYTPCRCTERADASPLVRTEPAEEPYDVVQRAEEVANRIEQQYLTTASLRFELQDALTKAYLAGSTRKKDD